MRQWLILLGFMILFNDGTSVTYDDNFTYRTRGGGWGTDNLLVVYDKRIKSSLWSEKMVSVYPIANVKQIKAIRGLHE